MSNNATTETDLTPRRQTEAEMATAFYSAYETVLAEYMRNSVALLQQQPIPAPPPPPAPEEEQQRHENDDIDDDAASTCTTIPYHLSLNEDSLPEDLEGETSCSYYATDDDNDNDDDDLEGQ